MTEVQDEKLQKVRSDEKHPSQQERGFKWREQGNHQKLKKRDKRWQDLRTRVGRNCKTEQVILI